MITKKIALTALSLIILSVSTATFAGRGGSGGYGGYKGKEGGGYGKCHDKSPSSSVESPSKDHSRFTRGKNKDGDVNYDNRGMQEGISDSQARRGSGADISNVGIGRPSASHASNTLKEEMGHDGGAH